LAGKYLQGPSKKGQVGPGYRARAGKIQVGTDIPRALQSSVKGREQKIFFFPDSMARSRVERMILHIFESYQDSMQAQPTPLSSRYFFTLDLECMDCVDFKLKKKKTVELQGSIESNGCSGI
jgi:hypothetical protein